MAVTFRSQIRWPKNELLLPAELFAVNVPPGLGSMDVRSPKIVDAAEMMRLTPRTSPSQSGNLSSVEGLVKSDLTARFPNPTSQWRRSTVSGTNPSRGPWQFQFTGGDVLLDLALEIYLLNTADYNPNDDLSVQIFARIYEHELLHVLDAIDILNNWLPPRLRADPTVMRYLMQGQAYTYGTPSMTVAQGDRDFQAFITNTIQGVVHSLWATESNRRTAQRDSPAQYKIVQDQVDSLRARQINRPRR
jgi:hypothetical protein